MRRHWLYLAAVWLSVTIALTNALVPFEPAMTTGPGSAFFPFNSEVSLGPVRGEDPVDARNAAETRDRYLHFSGDGGDVALLPQPPARTVVATLDLPPAGAMPAGLPAQSAPRFYRARAPPRA